MRRFSSGSREEAGLTNGTEVSLFRRSSSGGLRSQRGGADSIISNRTPEQLARDRPRMTHFDKQLSSSFPVVLCIGQIVLDAPDLEEDQKLAFFVTLSEMLKAHESLFKYVSYVINTEAKKCVDGNTLFRETGVSVMLARAMFSSYAAVQYLQPIVAAAWREVQSITPKEQDGVVSDEALLKTVDVVMEATRSSLSSCPPILRRFCQTLFSIVNVRHAEYGFKALANFFFLRFVVPALICPPEPSSSSSGPQKSPKSSDFSLAHRRVMVQLTRVIQCIANGVPADESASENVKVFVEQRIGRYMEDFFTTLITSRLQENVRAELDMLEFVGSDFNKLRQSFYSWLTSSMPTIRAKLGNMLQLHSWLATDEEVKTLMGEMC